jgi:peroxiredoxin/vacuolar-type H+-ATPase subunit E/Vma4
MYRKIMTICLGIVCLGCVNAVGQEVKFTINGSLKNMKAMPAKLYLTEIVPGGFLVKGKDSAEVVNGNYHFSGSIAADEAIGGTISDSPTGKNTVTNNLSVIIDKGEINIVSDSVISNFTATGTGALAQHQFEDMRKDLKKEGDELKKLAASEEFKTNKELQADVQKRSMGMLGKTIFDMYSYVKKDPAARVSPYTTYFLVQLPYLSDTGKDTLVNILPEKVKTDKLGLAIIQTLAKNRVVRDSLVKVSLAKIQENMSKVPIGSKAVDFAQNDPEGKSVSLNSYKGKYVLVDFWASWCKPCREENPNVLKAYQKYKNKEFTVLGVSLDNASAKAAWIKAIQVDGLPWTQISDLKGFENEAAKLYDVKSIPQNFLIDPNGVVVGKNLRGEELQLKLASIFK